MHQTPMQVDVPVEPYVVERVSEFFHDHDVNIVSFRRIAQRQKSYFGLHS